ncbi:MAG: hypothetical protein ACRDWE_09300 [Acidimicrobiales bacterium]
MATASNAQHRTPVVVVGPSAVIRWRTWVTKHPFGGAVAAGWIATWIATIFGIWFHGIGLPTLDWPTVNGAIVDPKGSIPVQFSIGGFLHYGDGIVFTIIFAIVIFPLLTRVLGRRMSPLSNMVKALIFAMALATISAGFLVPYVYFPHAGATLFATGYGWKLVFGIYLWHLAFGANLGLIYNPLPSVSQEAAVPEDPHRGPSAPERVLQGNVVETGSLSNV